MSYTYTLGFDGKSVLAHDIKHISVNQARVLDGMLIQLYGDSWRYPIGTRFLYNGLKVTMTRREMSGFMHNHSRGRYPIVPN